MAKQTSKTAKTVRVFTVAQKAHRADWAKKRRVAKREAAHQAHLQVLAAQLAAAIAPATVPEFVEAPEDSMLDIDATDARLASEEQADRLVDEAGQDIDDERVEGRIVTNVATGERFIQHIDDAPEPIDAAIENAPVEPYVAPKAVVRRGGRVRNDSPAKVQGAELVRYLRIHAKRPFGPRGIEAFYHQARRVAHLGLAELDAAGA